MLSRNNPLVRALTTRTMRQSVLSKNVKARDSKAVGEHAHAEHADHGDHGHHGYPYPGDVRIDRWNVAEGRKMTHKGNYNLSQFLPYCATI